MKSSAGEPVWGPRPSVARSAADAAGVALFGLLHAAAGGGVALAGLHLAIPGLLDVEGPEDAAAHAVALGLGSLRVPLGSGDVEGTFAFLGVTALALWGLASGTRRRSPSWRGGRGLHVLLVAVAFACSCALAAAVVEGSSPVRPSIAGAGVAGLAWGALGAAIGTLTGKAGRSRWERLPAPAVFVVVAAAIAAAWFLVALVVRSLAIGGSAGGGAFLLGLAGAPNAVAAAVAVGIGAHVDLAMAGAARPAAETFSLWDWAGTGAAPVYAFPLALAPLLGALAAGRERGGPTSLVRGAGAGAAAGTFLAVVAWAGSLRASAADAVLSLSIDVPETILLAAGWGALGAWLGPRLPWPGDRGATARVSDP